MRGGGGGGEGSRSCYLVSRKLQLCSDEDVLEICWAAKVLQA